MKYRRWSSVDFKEQLKSTERNPTPNKSQIMQKFLLVQIFHALLMQMKSYKMQGVTDLPPLQESRPRDS